jgi:predicted nucleic acid-binding protein
MEMITMSECPILIDNNALVDFFVGDEILKKGAEKLRRKFPFWITSPLCRYEFGNVMRTYVRLGKVSETDGVLMLRQGLKMVNFCSDCAEEVILAEAHASKLTFYDATYVADARWHRYELYTRDGEILKSCPEIARAIADA